VKKIALTIADISSMADFNSQNKASRCAATLKYFDPNSGYLSFNTYCGTSGNDWDQEIELIDWDTLIDTEEESEQLNDWTAIKNAHPEVLHSAARVSCTCPAFTYWGHAYNLTNEDSALNPNTIPPTAVNESGRLMRDPDKRYSCKHLIAVYKTYFV
jgi:hypothetical protein